MDNSRYTTTTTASRHTKIDFAFQDSFSIPINKEVKSQDLIFWGDNDGYPQYLWDLFLGSPIHATILKGRVDYIVAEGLKSEKKPIQEFIQEANSAGDTLDDIFHNICFDYEVFGAFMLQIVWAKGSSARKPKIAEIYHLPVDKFRYNITQDKIRYSKSWTSIQKPKTIEYDVFDLSNPTGTQIFHWNGNNSRSIYGQPHYESGIADINSSRLISEYHNNLIRNGMASSLMINFFDGTPSEDEQKQIVKDITKKFNGANGETKMVTFSEPGTQPPQVIPIETATNDKFLRLQDSVIQNIYSTHRVSSPSLFGLQTNANKVGTTNEFEISYSVFQKTTIRPRQKQLLTVLNKILSINFRNADVSIIPMVPVTVPFNDDKVKASVMYPSEMRSLLQDWNFIADAKNKPEGEVYIGNRDQPNTLMDALSNAKAADPNIILPEWLGDENKPIPNQDGNDPININNQ